MTMTFANPTGGVSGAAVLNAAYGWLGVPYLYGGGRGSVAQARSSGVDCSGFVYQVFSSLGFPNVGTDTVSQFDNPANVTVGSLAEAQPGDLVFFGSPSGGASEHVGIYIGNDMMIDAPHTGASVRLDHVTGFENLLGIKRVTGVASSPAAGGTTTAGFDTGSFTSGVTHLLVEAAAVAGALGLAVLGVYAATHKPKEPPP